MTIRLITFDLDDTLWHTAPVIEAAETRLRDWLQLHAPRLRPFTPEYLAELKLEVLEQEPLLRHRVTTLRRRVLSRALSGAGYAPAEAAELGEQAFQAFLEARHVLEVFADAEPVLSELAQRYRLGVLTNGNADVRRIGLGHHFSFLLCAEELGIGKPDPHPFMAALHEGGVAAHEAVHVGDNPQDDMLGAAAVGMRRIWFNPQGLPWEGPDAPCAEVRRLSEIPAILAGWT